MAASRSHITRTKIKRLNSIDDVRCQRGVDETNKDPFTITVTTASPASLLGNIKTTVGNKSGQQVCDCGPMAHWFNKASSPMDAGIQKSDHWTSDFVSTLTWVAAANRNTSIEISATA